MTPHEDNGTSVESLLVAERPEPRPEFATQLDARAAEGFAKERSRPRPRLVPALAGATGVALVAAVIGASGVLDRDPATIEDPAPAPTQLETREPAREDAAQSAETLESAPADAVARGRRQVARTADLTLSTPPGQVSEVADGVVDVTHRYRGFVAASNVSSGGGEAAGGEFDLKLPARTLQPALDDLSELAHVSALTEGSDDITRRFTTGRERLAEFTEQRDRLRAKLDAAATPEEQHGLRLRLREVRAELDGVRADLAAAAERVRMVPVHVGIRADADAPDAGWSIGDALDDAVRVLEVAVGVTVIALAGAVPVAIVAALLWLAARAWVRRRREASLDERPGYSS
jgi:Domain of unknown function (DUF4349)